MNTRGQRIAYYRKAANLTQAELSEACSVTAQAVSKWENDLTAPDISLLPKLAELFHITTDELLGAQRQTVSAVDPAALDMDKLLLKVRILSAEGDKVSVNLPVALAELVLGNGQGAGALFGSDKGGDAAKKIDWKQILALVKQGVVGKLVEIESSDGDRVEVFVE